MKFADYLDDVMTPEWKRAYLDYRGLQARIQSVVREQQGETLPQDRDDFPDREAPASNRPTPSRQSTLQRLLSFESIVPSRRSTDPNIHKPETNDQHPVESDGSPRIEIESREGMNEKAADGVREGPKHAVRFAMPRDLRVDTLASPAAAAVRVPSVGTPLRLSPGGRLSAHAPTTPNRLISNTLTTPSRLFSNALWRVGSNLYRAASRASTSGAPPVPLHTLLEGMTPIQRAFFARVDRELDKVDKFFRAKEREYKALSAKMRDQLTELAEHRVAYEKLHAENSPTWKIPPVLAGITNFMNDKGRNVSNILKNMVSGFGNPTATPPSTPVVVVEDKGSSTPASTPTPLPKRKKRSGKYDPHEYERACRRLNKALLEHYRGLEALNNYRILNVTGFRKVVKKFEKVTKIPAIEPYMREKVAPCEFAQDYELQRMLTEAEDQFSTHFADGNKKAAVLLLRQPKAKTEHHLCTFVTGLFLGLAAPALISGLTESFKPDVRARIPGWDSLLFIYANLVVPIVLALLVCVNLTVWTWTRINYIFIFGLNARESRNYKQYFVFPAFLLVTLCYAFWLSFTVPKHVVSPELWPLIWLLLLVVALVNPLPWGDRKGRFWLIRYILRLATSGVHHVQFTDFWLGDQFTSLTFPLGNIYFIACSYRVGFEQDTMAVCSKPQWWGVPFVIATLPLLARLLQSIRRWVDSGLYTHLINGGKYGSGIIYYLFYYLWRHNGATDDASFVLFCLFGAIYVVYATTWDFLMDWSVLKPHARHPLLRNDILYLRCIPMYYVALVTNIAVRLAWVFYIPKAGPSSSLRSFMISFLEVLRRWQWNFYRLENEHLGNMDQYRMTREVPMFYVRDMES